MARQQRIDYPGAIHHVMNGGVNGTAIFRDAFDRRQFLAELERSFSQHGIDVHALALMTTHYHLLIESTTGQLSAAMKDLGAAYSQGFNAKHGRYGPLFRSRFTSRLIDSPEYFETASRYIHLNPLDTGVTDLADYTWSSWPAYIGVAPTPPWLTTTRTLQHFGGIQPYVRFVTGGIRQAA